MEGVWGKSGRCVGVQRAERSRVKRSRYKGHDVHRGAMHGSTPLCRPRVVRVVVTHRAWLGSGLRSGLGLGPGSVAVSRSQGQG